MVSFTGLGSLPGTDFVRALGWVFDLTPGLPYLPELPARGPWAGLIGRTLGINGSLNAEYRAGQWQLSATAGIDQRRARATLRDDLDQLEERSQGYSGPFKVALAGPWTLASAVLRPYGGRVLADRGARRDLADALADGVGSLVSDVARRLPGAQIVLQVDEPSLPAVIAGRVPTEGGLFRHRAVEPDEVTAALARMTAEPGRLGMPVSTVVHCCAAEVPVALLATPAPDGAGFGGVSLDQDLITAPQWDVLAAGVERGLLLYLGCQPTSAVTLSADALTRRVLGVLRRLELGPALAERLVLTPACGLADAEPAAVRAIFDALRRTASRVEDELSR